MSLFTDASLVMIPSGVKDGKLYSIKPDDGVGDFTFTRGSNLAATRVDENGLIEKGRENLFLNSDAPVTQSITISNGTVYTLSFKGTGSIVAIGGGSFALNGTGATDLVQQYFVSSSTTITLTLSGTITEPQLERGLVATDYIETGATTEQAGILENLPRLDYSGGASCPSLLLEPTRSNLITQSEYPNSSTFNSVNGGFVWTYNEIDSPEGKQNASKWAAGNNNLVVGIYQNFSAINGTSYTFSVFAKKGNHNFIQLQNGGTGSGANSYTNFDLENGTKSDGATIINSFIDDFGNGWYRIGITFSVSADGTSNCSIDIIDDLSASRNSTFTGLIGDYFYAYGVQLEAGSYPTSYIPTYGTSVTRSEDLCVGAGDATTFNDSEGVLFVECSPITPTAEGMYLSVNNANTNNRILIGKQTGDSEIFYAITSDGTQNAISGGNFILNQYTKIAVKYKSGDNALWINGIEVDTFVFTSMPLDLSDLSFDAGGLSIAPFYGKIKNLVYFPIALTDSELAALTTI